jgi:hypothetical protein
MTGENRSLYLRSDSFHDWVKTSFSARLVGQSSDDLLVLQYGSLPLRGDLMVPPSEGELHVVRVVIAESSLSHTHRPSLDSCCGPAVLTHEVCSLVEFGRQIIQSVDQHGKGSDGLLRQSAGIKPTGISRVRRGSELRGRPGRPQAC